MKRQFRLFVSDILDAINHINEFVAGMSKAQFLLDEKTKSAVTRKVEVIGEASKNLPRHIKTRYKQIPWNQMAGIRDKIAHFYFGINYEVVWKVVKEDLPVIKPVIIQILNDLKDEDMS